MQKPFVIAVDWGTTSLRLWSLSATGAVLGEQRGRQGMATLRSADYPGVLASHLSDLEAAPDTPVLICGMAGAAQGWREAPYLATPARLTDIPVHAVAVSMPGWDVRILPGLAQRDVDHPDVMRGEETLLLGLALSGAADGAICLPGTHSKWVRIANGAVASFQTAMTGEMFSLLAEQSTLKHFMTDQSVDIAAEPAFEAAVKEMLAAPASLLGALFSLRAGPLLAPKTALAAVNARLSGLLIGAEIAGVLREPPAQVTLLASGPLTQAYERALEIAGIAFSTIEADALARAGLLHAAQLLWPDRMPS